MELTDEEKAIVSLLADMVAALKHKGEIDFDLIRHVAREIGKQPGGPGSLFEGLIEPVERLH